MRIYSNGNNGIKTTISYRSHDKTDKANKVMAKLIKKVFKDCEIANMQSCWPVGFDSNDTIIEYLGFKIIVSKYTLRENYYLFAFVKD